MRFVIIKTISISHCLHYIVQAVQIIFSFSNFKKSISNITGYNISAIRKFSSKYHLWSKLSITLNLARGILWVLICCLFIVANLHKIFMILRDNFNVYLWKIRFASILELNKAKTFEMSLFNLIFQVMYLTIFRSWVEDPLSRFSLPWVTSMEILLVIASFLIPN